MTRRLQRAFLLALAAPAAAACGGTTATQAGGDGGRQGDGATGEDSASAFDSGSPVDASVTEDSSVADDSAAAPDVVYADDCGTGTLPAPSGCTSFVYAPCGYDGGFIQTAECAAICPGETDAGMKLVNCYGYPTSAVAAVACSYCLPAGRRSAGLLAPPAVGEDPGSFFAHCAHLEQGSVHAFRRLARELAAHGAPASLIARARRAAVEETSHARAARRLARRFGKSVPRARAARLPLRDLATMALENAVEGCVRETYGVLVALWQSRTARDSGVREVLRTIARDEARHADLAARVAAWSERRLSADERLELRAASAAAVDDLREQLAFDPPRTLVEQVGLPRAAEARRLLEAALQEKVFTGLAA